MISADHIPNRLPNERTILFLRRHWFSVLSIVVAFCLLTIIPIGLMIYFSDLLFLWLDQPFLGPVLSIGLSIYFLSVWLFAFIEFTDYYLDTWIVTNERIINIEQHGLFHRIASELDLASVQDVTAKTHGMLQTIFQYGDVHIQTAGEKSNFLFKGVPHPEMVKSEIMKFVQDDKENVGHKMT